MSVKHHFKKNLLNLKQNIQWHCMLYIDPGLGGLLVQSLIAGCLTVVIFFRNSLAKIFSPLKRLFGKKKQ